MIVGNTVVAVIDAQHNLPILGHGQSGGDADKEDMIIPSGNVSVFASAGFLFMEGLALNATGTLFVANNSGGTNDEVTPIGALIAKIDAPKQDEKDSK